MSRREEDQSYTKPTPTLVIGLDKMGIGVAADVQRILQICNPPQFALTTCLGLDFSHKGMDETRSHNVELSEIEDQIFKDELFSERDKFNRHTIFECVAHELPYLQSTLRKSFHQLRTHERLIEAGLGSKTIIPLDVILIADLTSPMGSGAFLPILNLLQKMLNNEAYGMGHLLISAADLSSSTVKDTSANPEDIAKPYAALLELDALADPHQDSFRQKLATLLEMDSLDPLPFRIYLFDHKKERGSEVKDRNELSVIIGNFLLAMLLGGFAQRLADGLPWAEIQDRRAFFNSASATAALVDTRSLIEVCASRLGLNFLVTEMITKDPFEHLQEHQLASRIKAHLGDTGPWLRELCKNTSLDLVTRDQTWRLKLHFDDMNFKDVPEDQWADTIRKYVEIFEAKDLQAYQDRIDLNCASLIEETRAVFEAELAELPQNSCIYPGGIQASKNILVQLAKWLESGIENIERRRPDLPTDASLHALSQAALQVNPVPSWLSVILGIIGHFIETDDFVRWWRYRGTHIVSLRERCLQLLEHKYAAYLENILWEQLHEVKDELQKKVLEGQEQLDILANKIEIVRQKLSQDTAAYSTSSSSFRTTPVDQSIIEWVYAHHKPASEVVRQALLEKHAFLANWPAIDAGTLSSRLIKYGRMVFANLIDLSLEEILRQSSEHTATSVLSHLSQCAVPLLRPEFDSIGVRYSHIARYVLIPSPPETVFQETCGTLLNRWECVFSGTSNLVICAQVRHLIPLASLKNLTSEGYTAYQSLDADERDQLQIIKIEG